MCGRFTQMRSWAELVELYRITAPVIDRAPERACNIAPTHRVAVVRAAADGEGRELVSLRWGLVPAWARDPAIAARLINARTETVMDKPAFRAAYQARRCLIAADGFYEWRACAGRAKQPFYIAAADGGPLAFAGLWERWSRAGVAPIESCAILTTRATEQLRDIHDRMPVILPSAVHDPWLDRTAARENLRGLLQPYRGELSARPVSRRVNDVGNDDAGCLHGSAPTAGTQTANLFAESSPPLCHTR